MNTSTLIPIVASTFNGQSSHLVDARVLHQFLEVGRDFSNWIKGRIEEFDFRENEDYLLAKIGEQVPHQGGLRMTERLDYHLTLDMAKELAMVERTAQGKQARRYFIACEKALHARREPSALARVLDYPLATNLHSANLQAINRQAQTDVAGENAQRFHARREALLRLQRYVHLYGCAPTREQIAEGAL